MRVLVGVLCACTGATESSVELASTSRCHDTELSSNVVGLRPAMAEALASGPQAIAVAASGEVLLLDSLRGQVLAIDRDNVRVVATGIAPDATDLGVGADGSFVVFSPLRARASLFTADGNPVGELAIDRALRHVTGLSIGASRQLFVRNAYQETFSVGSPSAPVALPTTLAGKREGAFLLGDGRGISVRVADGAASLRVVTNAPGRRSTVVAAYPIPGQVDAAMLVGLAITTACARVERLDQNEALHVQRRVVCMDVTNGRVVLDAALAQPGTYVPRHELALGGTPPRLASLHASADRLLVRTCEVTP